MEFEKIRNDNILYETNMEIEYTKNFVNNPKITTKKTWNKLSIEERLIKTQEFIKSNFNDNKLLLEVEEAIKNNRMNTLKSVIYDPNTNTILSIPIIEKYGNKYRLNL